MTSASESRLAAIGRASPLDAAVAVAAGVCTLVAAARPDLFEGLSPEDVAAASTGAMTLAAALRAWWQARRRVRDSRRAARARRKLERERD